MDTSLDRALTRLDKGSLLRIYDGVGKGVAAFHGSLWVTQDNDLDDHFLEEGDSFVFDRPGLAIVQALSASSVLVFEAHGAGH